MTGWRVTIIATIPRCIPLLPSPIYLKGLYISPVILN